MLDVRAIAAAFEERYGEPPEVIVRAPGRVNLIGEHTDYNEGFVFPVAIDRATYVAASRRVDKIIRTFSRQFESDDRFSVESGEAIERSESRPWSNYIRGMARGFLARDLPLLGANFYIDSDVPLGSGLSSSAALEVATGYTLMQLSQHSLLGEELALMARGAENSFVGVQCGIMDQFISAMGQEGHALLLDCRDLSYRPVPLPANARVIVCDSGVRHSLGDSAYNTRRAECEEAVRTLKPVVGRSISALRDVTEADLEQHGHLLSPVVLARARHVVSENRRALDGAAALDSGDLATFGRLMYASHTSLRDDYEVSVPEIDLLVQFASQIEGCYGSRITGGGFGGSTVSLVADSAVEAFVAHLHRAYSAETGRAATTHICRAVEGVKRAGSS